MSHSVPPCERRAFNRAPLAVAFIAATLLAGCSTDVQRFGYTGSIGQSAAVQPAPVEPVQRAPLYGAPANNAPIGLSAGPARDNAPIGLSSGPARNNGALARANTIAPATDRPLPSPSFARAPAGTVTVASGDTAFSIARRAGVTVQELAEANDLAFPYNVQIGQQLAIPAPGAIPARNAVAAATPSYAPTPAPAPAPAAVSGAGSHKVVSGDTLYSISRRYGVGVGQLAAVNNLDDRASIRIGQTLAIPGSGAQGDVAQGGPLTLAARSEAGDGAANGGRVLQSRVLEAEEAASAVGGPSTATQAEPDLVPVALEPAGAKFRWPARGRIIAEYGMGPDGKRNDGINIQVPEGASVKAAEDGVVAYAGNELKGYGNLILIRHANDWVTAYAHNSTLLAQRGDTVKRGQIIAKAGQTGSVDQPQLHFEVRKGSKAVDPMPYLEGV